MQFEFGGSSNHTSCRAQKTMSEVDKLRAIAELWVSLWSAPVDWKLFDEIHAKDFRDCSSSGRPTDRKGFAEGLRAFVAAFPDVKTKVEDLVVDEVASKVAVRWCAVGTNTSRYLGVGPTNRATAITGIEIIQVDGGVIARRWGEWDISAHRDDASQETPPK